MLIRVMQDVQRRKDSTVPLISPSVDEYSSEPQANLSLSVTDEVLPRVQSTFSDSNHMSMGEFFNVVANGMASLSAWLNSDTIRNLDFSSPNYAPLVKVRGLPASGQSYLMRPRDVTNTLYVWVLQEMLRLNGGRPISTVFSRVSRNIPNRGFTDLGTLGMTKAPNLDAMIGSLGSVSTS